MQKKLKEMVGTEKTDQLLGMDHSSRCASIFTTGHVVFVKGEEKTTSSNREIATRME